MSVILAVAALYLAVANICAAALARRWRGVENGLSPTWVGALWPLVAPLLAAYYAAAIAYTVAAVSRGRWAPRAPRRTDRPRPAMERGWPDEARPRRASDRHERNRSA